ncbi:MAG: TetR/AcrR family transcriptional regulator [Cyanobacteria bacterium P01_H01_bin.15]
MNDVKKPASGRPRSVKSHKAMLLATVQLLGEVGFDAMSIEAIAARAQVGKTTIYRRYSTKEELVADAIESIREEVSIPDRGSFWKDIHSLIDDAERITLTPLGRKSVAMIVSSASSNSKFASIYWDKYLEPRRRAFSVVVERAKSRGEISNDLDPDLVFDAMSGIMLYTLIFPNTSDNWKDYVLRAMRLLIGNFKDVKIEKRRQP